MKHEIRRLKAGGEGRASPSDSPARTGQPPSTSGSINSEAEQLRAENGRLKEKIEQLVLLLEEPPRPGAPHQHLLPCHSFARTYPTSPCVEQRVALELLRKCRQSIPVSCG